MADLTPIRVADQLRQVPARRTLATAAGLLGEPRLVSAKANEPCCG